MKRPEVKWEYPACNLCGRNDFKVLWSDITTWEHEGVFRIVECSFCNLVYLNPRPRQKFIDYYYPRATYWGVDKGVDEKRRDRLYWPLYNYILKKRHVGNILDIGAGRGLFLTRFREEGWKIEGVELSRVAVSSARRQFGVKLRTGDFLDFSFPKNYFDVVTLNNTLEHLYQPKETLRKIGRVLKDNGILVIVVPNIDSFGAKIFGKNWHPLQPPRHLYHFSPATLRKMLIEAGFQATKTSHSYWAHNYYSLFESFRFCLSPRFRKSEKGGFYSKAGNIKIPWLPHLLKETGKNADMIFAFTISIIGAFFRRGEVITVYAKKA